MAPSIQYVFLTRPVHLHTYCVIDCIVYYLIFDKIIIYYRDGYNDITFMLPKPRLV